MINDLRNSNNWRGMSKSQRGCYIDLLCVAWTESDPRFPCSLTGDREVLYRQTDCFTDQDRRDTDVVLSAVFKPDAAGRLFNARQREIWEQQNKKSQSRRDAANARWSKERAASKETDMQAECNRHANASDLHAAPHMPTDSDSDSNSDHDQSTDRCPPVGINLTLPQQLSVPECFAALSKLERFWMSKGKPITHSAWETICFDLHAEGCTPDRFIEAAHYTMQATKETKRFLAPRLAEGSPSRLVRQPQGAMTPADQNMAALMQRIKEVGQ